MNNSINNNSLKESKSANLDWNLVQAEMKNKLGLDIYESWLKKITFVEEINNYILLSVPTRFIRDWITSRYLDQILKIIKNYKKEIIRIEFKITENKLNSIHHKNNDNIKEIKDLNNICENCAREDISVSQNLILFGFKQCESCRISKTIEIQIR